MQREEQLTSVLYSQSKMVGLEVLRSIIRHEISPTGRQCIYGHPGTGKTFFARAAIRAGFPVVDSDFLFYDILKGKFMPTDPLKYNEVETMTGWDLFCSLAVHSGKLAVTNLHSNFLLYAERSRCSLIGVFLSDKDFERNVESIRKKKLDMRHIDKLRAWRLEVKSFQKSDRDPISVWISTFDDLHFHYYTPICSSIGRANRIMPTAEGFYGDKGVAEVVRYAVAKSFLRSGRKRYVSLGSGATEMAFYASIKLPALCLTLVPDFVLNLENVPSKLVSGKGDLVKYNLVLSYISLVGLGCSNILVSGQSDFDFLKSDFFRFKRFSKSKMNEKFVLIIFSDVSEYNIPDVISETSEYRQMLLEELKLFDTASRHRNCVRCVYFMIARNLFNSPLTRLKAKVIFLPFARYDSTRVALVSSRVDRDYSFSEIYFNVRKFNYLRSSMSSVEESYFKAFPNKLGLVTNMFNFVPKADDFVAALWSFSTYSGTASKDVLRFVRKIAKSNSDYVILLPNACVPVGEYSNSRVYLDKEKLLLTIHGDKVYKDVMFNPNVFLGVSQVSSLIDLVLREKYLFSDSHLGYKIDADFPVCDLGDYSMGVWFAVTNIIPDTKVQHIFNSQTYIMRIVSRVIRRCFGFDSNTVYKLRVRSSDEISFVSSKATSINDGVVRAMPGHFINLVVASTLGFTVDVHRFIDTVIGNLEVQKGNVETRNLIQKYLKRGQLAESDSVFNLWHTASDFDGTIPVIRHICNFIGTESYLNVSGLYSELTRLDRFRDMKRVSQANLMFGL